MIEINLSETHIYRLIDFFNSEDGEMLINSLKEEINACDARIKLKALKVEKKEQFEEFLFEKRFLEGKQEALNDFINKISESSLQEDLQMLKRQALRKP